MPLTEYQAVVARALAKNRTEDSYLAGGAALHLQPNSRRTSNDLDYFHDSVERVAEAFAADERVLKQERHRIEVEMKQPGYIRAIVSRGSHQTKVEWAHDSAWRFMPTVASPEWGYTLHPIDLAVNKVLALAGRDEPRDFIDIMEIDAQVLPLGALCWAAAGKDPGFTPLSLLELLKRRGRYRPEDFERLHLREPVDLRQLKSRWLEMLEAAEGFISRTPPGEVGCLYYSPSRQTFIAPTNDRGDAVPHYGRPGGVLPRILESSL